MGSGPDETGRQELQGRLAVKAPHEDEETKEASVNKCYLKHAEARS